MLAGLGHDSLTGLGSPTAVLLPGVSSPPGIVLAGASLTLGSTGSSSVPASTSGTGSAQSAGPVLQSGVGSTAGVSSSGISSSSAPNGPVLFGGSNSAAGSASAGARSDSVPNGPVLMSGAGATTNSAASGAGGLSDPAGSVLFSQSAEGSSAGTQGAGTTTGSAVSGGVLWSLYGAGAGASSSSGSADGSLVNDSSLSAKYTGGASGGQGATAALFVPGGLVFFVTGATGADAAGSGSQQGSGGSTSLTAADAHSTVTTTPLVYQPGNGDGPGVVLGVWTGDEGGVQYLQVGDPAVGESSGGSQSGRPHWNDEQDFYFGPRWQFEFEADMGMYDPPSEIPKPHDELAGVVPTAPDGTYTAGDKQEFDTLPAKVGEKGREFGWFMADWIGPDVIGWAAKGLAGAANAGLYWFATIAKKADPIIDGVRAAVNAVEEIQGIGRLAGKSASEIADLLARRGYNWTRGSNGGTVWTKCLPDGNTVAIRIDPPATRPQLLGFADEVPHVHKEVVPTQKVTGGNYLPKHATRLDDDGIPSGDPRATHIPGGQ